MVLRKAAGGRAPDAPLLDRIKQLCIRFRPVAKRLGLDDSVTPYALRHSSIVRMLLNGVPARIAASHHDTSISMIEKHYSRYILGDPSDTITRRTLLDFGAGASAPDNVIPITTGR